MSFFRKYVLLTALCCLAVLTTTAQSLLQKKVSIAVNNAPLQEVLKNVGRQAGFTFSYNSNVVPGDKPVTLRASNVTVSQALELLLKGTCTWKEVGNHVVLQSAHEKFYQISGYILDAASGEGIASASVYERDQLVSAITDKEGYFRLRLKSQYPTARVYVSKELYEDTTLLFQAGKDYQFRLPVKAAPPRQLDEIVVSGNDPDNLFRNFFSRLFIGSKLRSQTRNITDFIATRPVQSSFIPGIGTHGRLGAQVVNKFSLNILGGYSAGVNGVELGGLFNINKGDVRFAQMAGLFNLSGGSLEGVQAAGLSNTILGNTDGVQFAGLTNFTRGKTDGIQAAGVVNTAVDSLTGVQIAGVVNLAGKAVQGTQAAGVANLSRREIKGTQVAGVFNYARKLDGIQIGLINVADSSDGISLGLINLAKNGYHKLAFYADEVVPLNGALKTGMPALYTILFAGYNPANQDRVVTMGAGLGRQMRFSKSFSLTIEGTVQHLFLGDWDRARMLYRFRPSLCYQPSPWISLFTGPSINGYNSTGKTAFPDYLQDPAKKGLNEFRIADNWTGWIGWQFGIAFF